MKKLLDQNFIAILESLGSVIVTDKEGRYVYVSNERLSNGLQKEDELIGRLVSDVVPETKVKEVIENRKPYLFRPSRLITPKGPRDCFISYFPIIDNNECTGCLLFATFRETTMDAEFIEIIKNISSSNSRENYPDNSSLSTSHYFNSIIGESPTMLSLKAEISLISRSPSTVLINGETGTGKELVARSIHELSPRKSAPLIQVNCSAIPSELAEAEFFGYEDGAFTGAKKGGKAGKFELASNGSLFLDEIGSLSISLQPKILRAIQENEITRVGGTRTIPVSPRIIAATNVPLEDLVKTGEFRQDLYYRLNVIQITVPPLRDRMEDIPLLIKGLIFRLNKKLNLNIMNIDNDVIDLFMHYSWPGNVRELQNVIECAMNYAASDRLTFKDFSFFIPRVKKEHEEIYHLNQRYQDTDSTQKGKEKTQALSSSDKQSFEKISENYTSTLEKNRMRLEAQEKQKILSALALYGGNKKKAAQHLGIARSTLYKKWKNMK